MSRDIVGLVVGNPSNPDAHPLHLDWLRSISADLVALDADVLPGLAGDSTLNDLLAGLRRRFTPPTMLSGYDIIVVEAPAALYALPWVDLPETRVVFLHTSWRLDGRAAHSFTNLPSPIRPLAALDRTVDAELLSQLVNRYVDGVVTVSDLFINRLRARGVSTPAIVHRPYVETDRAARLASTEPAYDTSTAVMVGTHRGHKGVDLIVRAWPRVRESHPDARLMIAGSGHPEHYGETAGVEVAGYVESVPETLGQAAFSVHPARIDAFPVAVLEALCAGLPVVMTETTGVAEVVDDELPDWLIVEPDPPALADAVTRYLDLPVDDRRALGAAARTVGEQFAGPSERSFRTVLRDLLYNR